MPYSLEPDDDPQLVADAAAPRTSCRRCGDPVDEWQGACASCGHRVGPSRSKARAIPVAPPDEAIPFAEEVDVDDPFDVPVADVVTDRFGVPVVPYGRPRRGRRPRPRTPTVGWHRLLPMFVGYGVMMAVSIAFGVLLVVAVMSNGTVDEEDQNWGLFAVEAVDAAIVIIVAIAVGKLPAKPIDLTHRVGTWIVAFPLLAFLLVLNIGMVMFLRRVFQVEGELGPEITGVTLLLMCVQPAIVEEWFFRHLALGSLREKIGLHWAIWASAGMFSLAHIFNPIGMPYLLLLGVVLGYLRVHSRSLVLPMLLHFLHNLAVLYANRVM